MVSLNRVLLKQLQNPTRSAAPYTAARMHAASIAFSLPPALTPRLQPNLRSFLCLSRRATVVVACAAMVAREFDGFDDGYGDYGDGSEEVCGTITRLITLFEHR